MKIKAFITISCLAALLSSCGLYSKYHRQTQVDESIYRNEYRTEDTTSIASLPWKDLFQDKYLRLLIDSALVHNTDLRTAKLRTDAAMAMLQTARLAYLPSLELNPQGTITRGNKETTNVFNLVTSTTWELDIFGKATNAKHGAKEALEASRAYEQAVQTQLIATVASSYYTLLLLDEQMRINKETFTNWEQTIHSLEALKQAGKGTDTGILQAKANCLSIESSILEMQKSIKECENALCSVLGQPYRMIERGTISEQVFPESLSVGVPVLLLSHRPDVRMAEAKLAQAFYATNAARSAFYPSITLSGNVGWTNNGGGIISNPSGWLLNAIGSLTQPLFKKGQNVANLKVAKIEQEMALLAFQQSLLNAGEEVNKALTSWQTARQQLKVDNEQVSLLREACRKTEILMHNSSVNYIEVLTAGQSLLAAEQKVAVLHLDEIKSVILLYQALGGGKNGLTDITKE